MRPILLANRFEHLDGDDHVEQATGLPVIFEQDVGRALQPFAGELVLRGRNREPGEAMAVRGGAFGKAAPTAADLQHRGTGFEELAQDALVFVALGFLQALGGIAEQAGGVGHALVEPERIEIVADVVMRLNVALAAGERVAPHKAVLNH